MPTYVFKGRNRLNEVVVGERVADNREALRQILRREQMVLTSVKERAARLAFRKLADARRSSPKTCRSLHDSFRDDRCRSAAGPVSEILAQQQDNKYFQQTLMQVRQDVEEGSTLAAAMARHPKVFDELYTNMVEAGETGGILDIILQRLSTFIEKIVKLKRATLSPR